MALSRKRGSVIKLLVEGGCKEIDAAMLGVIGGGFEEPIRSELLQAMLKSEHVTTSGLKSAWTAAKSAKLDNLVSLIETKLPESDRPTAPSVTPAPSDSAALQSVAGNYKNESGTKLVFCVKENQLTIRAEESEQSFPLTMEAKDHFKTQGMEIFFVRENEKVTSMKMKVGDRELLYTRVVDAAPISSDKKPATDATPKDRPETTVSVRPDYNMDSPHWPGFRGTLARGISEKAQLATEWDGEIGKISHGKSLSPAWRRHHRSSGGTACMSRPPFARTTNEDSESEHTGMSSRKTFLVNANSKFFV